MQHVGVAILEHEGMYLVGKRGGDDELTGMSEFPGGKQLLPESIVETVIRETKEETGLDVETVRLLDTTEYEYNSGSVCIEFWLCQLTANELAQNISSPWRWLPREELYSLTFPPANQNVLTALS